MIILNFKLFYAEMKNLLTNSDGCLFFNFLFQRNFIGKSVLYRFMYLILIKLYT